MVQVVSMLEVPEEEVDNGEVRNKLLHKKSTLGLTVDSVVVKH